MSVELLSCVEFPAPFHSIACAFTTDPVFCAARFPTTANFRKDSAAALLNLRPPLPQPYTERLCQVLRESMDGLELTASQLRHLQALQSGSALAVTTGQQVGFLGGPLYTALKAAAALALAQQLQEVLWQPIVPIFWVEDNDSDGREAGSNVWWQPDGTLQRLTAASDAELLQPIAVSARLLSPAGLWQTALHHILPELSDELRSIVLTAYSHGKSWSQAFVVLLHWLFGSSGLLFLRASVARRHGLFCSIVQQALFQSSRLGAALSSGIQQLRALGYQELITPQYPLVHFHTPEGFRYRVRYLPSGEYGIARERYTAQQLRSLFEQECAAFSPSALLRPLCQDAILPTVAVVLGPAEVAYWAQLRELYEALQVPMPAVVLRPSVTLVPPQLHRLLVREGWSARDFFAPWQAVERALLERLPPMQLLEHSSSKLQIQLQQWYQHLSAHLWEIDPTLVPSLGATHHRIARALQRWQRRFRAALRRRSETLLSRARRVWSLVYPDGHPQERLLSWLQLFALCGRSAFQEALVHVTALPSGHHAILTLAPSSEPSTAD
ncbi:MAG: bacillithiol biosynthesis cysteine-adding enzyme BshC [Chlorobiota bacterium]